MLTHVRQMGKANKIGMIEASKDTANQGVYALVEAMISRAIAESASSVACETRPTAGGTR